MRNGSSERVIFPNVQNQKVLEPSELDTQMLRHFVSGIQNLVASILPEGVLPNSRLSVPISRNSDTVGIGWSSIISILPYSRFSKASTKHRTLLDSSRAD